MNGRLGTVSNEFAINASVRYLQYTGPHPNTFLSLDTCNYTLEELYFKHKHDVRFIIDKKLADVLKHLPNLKILNLTNCKTKSPKVWDAIFKGVLTPSSKLKERHCAIPMP